MLSREDRILSEILVSRGLVGRERIESCARRLAQAAPGTSLADALRDGGDLAPAQARNAAEEARSIEEALAPELPAGKKLGEFRLLREIGRGGMGIVYEAVQESLGRHVALKVLPAGAALDERLAIRFLREARAAARLRHPGIVPVYTSGRAEGVLYFAMELIDGHTLAEALAAGPLAPAEAARIAAQVARALDHAHAAGLVHRDVKPENILLARDGRARIADFGLVLEASADARTLSRHVLGTPAFIAPEQARGGEVDARSDIYGLGAVMWAMLAGSPPYEGEVPSLILARVLTEPPRELLAACPGAPAPLVEICRRAMARDPRRRPASAAALADELERFLDAAPAAGPAPAAAQATRRPSRWVWTGCGAAALVALAWWSWPASRRDPPAGAGPAPAAEFEPLARIAGTLAAPALSPDGRFLAYSGDVGGGFRVYLQRLPGGAPQEIGDGSGLHDVSPAFAPDGKSLAYSTPTRSVQIVELPSLRERALDVPMATGLAWTPDGDEIVYTDRVSDGPGLRSTSSRLFALDVRTGRSRPLTGIDGSQPACSAASGRVAFVSRAGGRSDLWTVPLAGGSAVRLTDDDDQDWSPVWSSDGQEIYFGSDRDGAGGLYRIRIDRGSGRAAAAPRRVSDAIFPAPFHLAGETSGAPALLLASRGHAGRLYELRLDDRAGGSVAHVARLPERFLAAASPDPSPDGRWLAFTALTSQDDLALSAADGSGARLLTADAFADRHPRWSPDAGRIAFDSDRSGRFEIWTVRPDGGDLRRRTASPAAATHPVWSPDGARLAYRVEGQGGFVIPADGPGPDAAPALLPALDDGSPFAPSSWSADGEWIAGTAGGVAIYAPASQRLRRLTDFGAEPVWLDPERLLFTTEHELHLFDLRAETSRVLYAFTPSRPAPAIGVARDGHRVWVSVGASPGELWRVRVHGD